MRTLLASVLALGAFTSAAFTEPLVLSDVQMDTLTAGQTTQRNTSNVTQRITSNVTQRNTSNVTQRNTSNVTQRNTSNLSTTADASALAAKIGHHLGNIEGVLEELNQSTVISFIRLSSGQPPIPRRFRP
jgi:hypothetical protein